MRASGEGDGTLADRLTQVLSEQIRSHVYPVNARLPTEQFMTEHYGVSRTVVREAISRLKSEGLVETRQGSGTVVCEARNAETFRLQASDENPAEAVLRVIELRRGIETEMAALAAERRSAQELARIQAALAAIDKAVAKGGDGVEEDLAFHMAISRASHNTHYTDLLGMLTRSLHDAIRVTRSNEARRADLTAEVLVEHAALVDAIRLRDPAAARTAAFLHMRNTAGRLQQAGRDFWTGDSQAAARRLGRARLAGALKG